MNEHTPENYQNVAGMVNAVEASVAGLPEAELNAAAEHMERAIGALAALGELTPRLASVHESAVEAWGHLGRSLVHMRTVRAESEAYISSIIGGPVTKVSLLADRLLVTRERRSSEGVRVADEHTMHHPRGGTTTTYHTYDAAGNRMSEYINIGTIEDSTTVVERDEQGRPVKVTGFRTDSPLVGAIVGALTGETNETGLPAGGEYREMTLHYDDRGLLTEAVETEHGEAAVSKTSRRLFYDDQGVHAGYMERKLVDTVGGEEVYDTTFVSMVERTAERWREVSYRKLRHGLMPFRVREGTGNTQREDVRFYIDLQSNEQWPYILARNPEQIRLMEVDRRGQEVENGRSVALPSFIPAAAAQDLACGTRRPEQVAARPDFPETEGVKILDTDDILGATSNLKPGEVGALLDELAAKRTVTLPPLNLETPRSLDILRDFYRKRGLWSGEQKLAAIAMLHPMLSRGQAEPESRLAMNNDSFNLLALCRVLGTTPLDMELELERIKDSLTGPARDRLTRLLTLPPPDAEA